MDPVRDLPQIRPNGRTCGRSILQSNTELCCGTAADIRAHVGPFFAGLSRRADEVTQRCRRVLQAKADAHDARNAVTARRRPTPPAHVDPPVAVVEQPRSNRGCPCTAR